MSTALVSIIVAVAGVIGTAATAYFSLKSKQPEHKTADWSLFSAEMREWTEDRLKERDERITDLEDDARITQGALRVITNKYHVTLLFSQVIHSRLSAYVEPERMPAVPNDIREDWTL